MTTPLAPDLADVEILAQIHARAAEVDAARKPRHRAGR